MSIRLRRGHVAVVAVAQAQATTHEVPMARPPLLFVLALTLFALGPPTAWSAPKRDRAVAAKAR